MTKIRQIQLDETERGALKAIILLNPDSRGLQFPETVLSIREKLYASLEAYCKVRIDNALLLILPLFLSLRFPSEKDDSRAFY
jgi:hypothetical protein